MDVSWNSIGPIEPYIVPRRLNRSGIWGSVVLGLQKLYVDTIRDPLFRGLGFRVQGLGLRSFGLGSWCIQRESPLFPGCPVEGYRRPWSKNLLALSRESGIQHCVLCPLRSRDGIRG